MTFQGHSETPKRVSDTEPSYGPLLLSVSGVYALPNNTKCASTYHRGWKSKLESEKARRHSLSKLRRFLYYQLSAIMCYPSGFNATSLIKKERVSAVERGQPSAVEEGRSFSIDEGRHFVTDGGPASATEGGRPSAVEGGPKQ